MKNSNKNQSDQELKIQGVPSKVILYQRAAKHAAKSINKLAKLLDSNNESVVLGAAKTLLAKCLPDLTHVEGEVKSDGQIQLFVNVGSGFVPASLRLPTASTGSITKRQPSVQSSGLAQES